MFSLVTLTAVAQDESAQQPLDPAYDAVHPFVLVNSNASLFASLMPSYSKPQDTQLIYRISAKDPALTFLVRDADMVTFKPERFNLQRLLRNESFAVRGDVYLGHLQRGGERVYENFEVRFDKVVYKRPLVDLARSGPVQSYEMIEISNGVAMLVHQIQTKPSYDHLVLVNDPVSCIRELNMGTAVPEQNAVLLRLVSCGALTPLYFEAHDFQ